MQVWEYTKAKQEERLVLDISKKQLHLEKEVILLRFNYFFVKIYKEPQESPYKTYITIFWNQEFNLYKKHNLVVGEMKHEMEESNGGVAMKRHQLKNWRSCQLKKSWEKIIL